MNFCGNIMDLPLYQSNYALGEKFEIKTMAAVALCGDSAIYALLAVAYMQLTLE